MAALLRDSVYQAIRHAILTCEFKPGQELREQILAERYRVSRSPIRDSLLRLEQEKLVTVLPRQGYRVNPVENRDVEELFGLRLIISPACAAEAARATDGAVQALDRFRHMPTMDAGEAAFLTYNRDFHSAVLDLVGNSRMAAVEFALVEEFDRLVRISFLNNDSEWTPKVIREHGAIIDAIQAHDGVTAYRRTYDHIAGGQRRIRALLNMDEPPQHTSYLREGVAWRASC